MEARYPARALLGIILQSFFQAFGVARTRASDRYWGQEYPTLQAAAMSLGWEVAELERINTLNSELSRDNANLRDELARSNRLLESR